MLTTVGTSFNIHDLFGANLDARRVKAWATTNAPSDTIHDTATGETRIGGGYATIAADGTGTFTHWAPGADGNPTSWQTTYHFDVPDRTSPKGRRPESFGPFTVTGTSKTVTNKALTTNVATLTTSTAHGLVVGNSVTVAGVDATFNGTYTITATPSATTLSYAKTAADVASVASAGTLTSQTVKLTALVQEQAVPPTYLSTVTALLDTKVTAAQTARTGAEAARDGAVAIVGPVDATVEGLIKNTGGIGPLTSAALAASYVARRWPNTDWSAIPSGNFLNGWSSLGAGSALQWRVRDDRLEMIGFITGGTTGAQAFIIPYMASVPPSGHSNTVWSGIVAAASGVAQVYINPDFRNHVRVTPYLGGTNTFVDFAGVSIPLAPPV